MDSCASGAEHFVKDSMDVAKAHAVEYNVFKSEGQMHLFSKVAKILAPRPG